jgi:hypothetical protein
MKSFCTLVFSLQKDGYASSLDTSWWWTDIWSASASGLGFSPLTLLYDTCEPGSKVVSFLPRTWSLLQLEVTRVLLLSTVTLSSGSVSREKVSLWQRCVWKVSPWIFVSLLLSDTCSRDVNEVLRSFFNWTSRSLFAAQVVRLVLCFVEQTNFLFLCLWFHADCLMGFPAILSYIVSSSPRLSFFFTSSLQPPMLTISQRNQLATQWRSLKDLYPHYFISMQLTMW